MERRKRPSLKSLIDLSLVVHVGSDLPRIVADSRGVLQVQQGRQHPTESHRERQPFINKSSHPCSQSGGEGHPKLPAMLANGRGSGTRGGGEVGTNATARIHRVIRRFWRFTIANVCELKGCTEKLTFTRTGVEKLLGEPTCQHCGAFGAVSRPLVQGSTADV